MTTQKYLFGTVSHGTMREEDLIPCFLDTLKELDPKAYEAIRNDDDNKPIFDWLYAEEEGAEYPEWTSDFLWETVADALQNCAAPYFYFGSHPGDGCDYGFWLVEDAAQQVEDNGGLNVSDTSEVPEDYSGEVLHVNDHGNATLYSADHGKLTEVWSIV